jgi:vacuolar-type H+-ATPase catalytic subunit A/Vma1
MPKQFEDSVASSNEVRKIVSDEIKPLLDKITELVEKLERYHQHDVEFQQKFLMLVSEMFRNQQISMDAFDKLDLFMRQEFFWGQQKPKET